MDFPQKLGANAYIYYSKTKSKTGFASRDFVMNYICNLEEDGSLVVACSSYNCLYNMKENDGVIRGDIAIGGLLIEPVPGNPGKSYLYVMQEADLKSSVPSFLLKPALKDQGMQVERIRKVLPRWKNKEGNRE